MSDFEVFEENLKGLTDQLILAGRHVDRAKKAIANGQSGEDDLKLANAQSMLVIASFLCLLVRIEYTRDESPTWLRGLEN